MKISSVSDHTESVYGRRRGRRLRPGREKLLQKLLPSVEVKISEISSSPTTLFPDSVQNLWLEIGFGAGEHIAEQAVANPEVGLIGCEPFRNGVAALLARIKNDQLTNIS